jgi:hypothetical protein
MIETITYRSERSPVAKAAFVGRCCAGALTVTAMVACDLRVTNPGPVADDFLNDPGAYAAIVNGIVRPLSLNLTDIAIDVGLRTREVHATSANDYYQIYPEAHAGTANPDVGQHWGPGAQSRWLAEDAIRRFGESLSAGEFQASAHVARAYLWGGYANRLGGEYFCEATFNSGPAEPGRAFLERAEEAFTRAIEVGQAAALAEVVTAATAGRASVRVQLGDWAGAVADAQVVPADFVWRMPYFGDGDWRYYNTLHYYTAGDPARMMTIWNTPYEEVADDPRTPWLHQEDEIGSGSLQPWGTIPWWPQRKFDSITDSINLSSGREMRLILAESALRDGDIGGATTILNSLRTSAGAGEAPAPANLEAAWTWLKRERGIELWLEGRRLADLRRWKEGGTPGDLHPAEYGLTRGGPDLRNAVLCLPIPNSERNQNPNLEPL